MLGTIILMVITVSLLIGINALYVAGEFAAVSARKPRLVQAANSGNRLAKLVLPVVTNPHKLDNYIAASQVGITLSSVVLGIYGQQEIAPLLEPVLLALPFINELAAAGVSALIVLIALTTLQVILGELVPKSIAILFPEEVALATAVPMLWSANLILKPFIVVLNGSGILLMRMLGAQHEGGHKHIHSAQEIQLLIQQSHEGGLLDAEKRDLLENALRFAERRIGEIVVPRTRMIAAPVEASPADVLRLAAKGDYSRIPIYENDMDHILGFVHIKDLFRLHHSGKTPTLRAIVREASFLPETAYISEVWDTLNRQQRYLAIIFDEYGGTLGMVTREDLIEEVFGDVQDEFDRDEGISIETLSENTYRVRGDMPLHDLNHRLHLHLPTTDAYTVNGLISNALGKIPAAGDTVTIDVVSMLVESVEDNAVLSVCLLLSSSQDQA